MAPNNNNARASLLPYLCLAFLLGQALIMCGTSAAPGVLAKSVAESEDVSTSACAGASQKV